MKETFSFNEAIDEMRTLVFEIYTNQGIEIRFRTSATEGLMVQGDRGHLQQAFLNLLSTPRMRPRGKELERSQ